ncbi:hypothetical protein N5W20_03640 [Candidatus Kirkpatrickella diaphorinae]|uniref:Pertussis toxin subunit 1 n=1 Tax=Candidatus Kirkpatrickella diaphorinae TaxID=2984322 RepID=A0ABY6GL10_9PROT|nr:hypothetical protein [Candidatus Kirkpatrickella diaphorinae]UYH51959.1 hypothetical protein N5W20_03640 [Candidatus Kirkpatrickella diaphorinae]
MKFLVASLFVASSFFTSVSYAITPPDWVYKVAMGDPIQKFSEGWVTMGIDRDLMRYLTWSSVRDESTYYICSNEFLDDLEPVIEEIARNHPDQIVYVYQIRPTDNFHNLEESVRFARDALPPGEAREALHQAWLATRHWAHGSWPATAAISGAQIFGATPYNWVDGRLRQGRFISNPGYLYALPEASNGPMPVRNATVEEAVVAEDPHGVGFIPGAIVPDGCNAQPRCLSATPSTSCLPLKSVPLHTLHSRMIAKMIAAGILTGTRSAQLWTVPGHDEL